MSTLSPTTHVSRTSRDGILFRESVVSGISGVVPEVSADSTNLASATERAIVRADERFGSSMNGVLSLLEGMATSKMEGITAPTASLLMSLPNHPHSSTDQAQIGNAITAFSRVMSSDAPLLDALIASHADLLDGHPRLTPGEYRRQTVWIGGSHPSVAAFVPPAQESVPALMSDLAEFAHERAAVSPLVRAAIAHAQYETIHPYLDGNGRTGRFLISRMLRDEGVTERVNIPIALGMHRRKGEYIDALVAFRSGDAEPIVDFVIRSAFRAVNLTGILRSELDSIRARWEETATVRRDSRAYRILDILLDRPVVTAAGLSELIPGGASALYPALRRLTEVGILTEYNVFGGSRVWVSGDVQGAVESAFNSPM